MPLPTCSKCGSTVPSEMERNGVHGIYIIVYCIKCGTVYGTYSSKERG